MIVNRYHENYIEFAQQTIKIDGRYDKQNGSLSWADNGHWCRRWTPVQLRRIRKQRNKWHRRLLG